MNPHGVVGSALPLQSTWPKVDLHGQVMVGSMLTSAALVTVFLSKARTPQPTVTFRNIPTTQRIWSTPHRVERGWGSVAFWSHPRIHPKLRRLTRKYRCLGGIPCLVKLLKVKVRCRLTRKRSLVRVQSCLPFNYFRINGIETQSRSESHFISPKNHP